METKTPSKKQRPLRVVDVKRASAPSSSKVVQETVQFDEQRDSGVASSLTSFIRTADQLLAYTKVDMSVWEIDRQVVNKWEGFCVPRATRLGQGDKWVRPDATPVLTQMFQIKIWLKRKKSIMRGIESLVAAINSGATPLVRSCGRRVAAKPATKTNRAFEPSIVDPHIGMLCLAPEADGKWDMDISAATILNAVDKLVVKASVFGPFDEVFMAFGNDYVHADNIEHETTAGTRQPEMISWHRVFDYAERVAIEMVKKLRPIAPKLYIYQVPGNHSRHSDFVMARILRAYFRNDNGVVIDAGSSPYKFHRYGVNLIGFEHGHSVKPQLRYVGLMANERPTDWCETKYREWHLGDQHRKSGARPSMFEEQGVSIEFLPSLVVANEWHRLKAFNHQQRSAMGFVWDSEAGPVCRFQHNVFE